MSEWGVNCEGGGKGVDACSVTFCGMKYLLLLLLLILLLLGMFEEKVFLDEYESVEEEEETESIQ